MGLLADKSSRLAFCIHWFHQATLFKKNNYYKATFPIMLLLDGLNTT